MKPYLLSLGAGVLVGVVYSVLGVRSPAPPVIALLGLLGILVGEFIAGQTIPLVRRIAAGDPVFAVCPSQRQDRGPDVPGEGA